MQHPFYLFPALRSGRDKSTLLSGPGFSAFFQQLGFGIVIDYPVLQPAVDGVDDDFHHDMGAELQIADGADENLLTSLDVLEVYVELVGMDGQDVTVVGGCLSQLQDAGGGFTSGGEAELLQPIHQYGLHIMMEGLVDFVTMCFQFGK